MDDLENYLHVLDSQNKELILTGDLNCELSLSVLQSHSHRFMDILEPVQGCPSYLQFLKYSKTLYLNN